MRAPVLSAAQPASSAGHSTAFCQILAESSCQALLQDIFTEPSVNLSDDLMLAAGFAQPAASAGGSPAFGQSSGFHSHSQLI